MAMRVRFRRVVDDKLALRSGGTRLNAFNYGEYVCTTSTITQWESSEQGTSTVDIALKGLPTHVAMT